MSDSPALYRSSSEDGWLGAPIGRVAAPLRDQALEVVRRAILDLRFIPGQRLVERELIEQLGVSRTTVRDVLARLAVEGLVTNVPHRGTIVTILTREEAEDIYDMRVALEGLAVRRFIERALPEEFERLGATVDAVRGAVASGDAKAALRAKDRFYEVLLAGARSPRLASTLAGLQAQVQLLRATSLSAPGRPHESADEIGEIVAAIQAKDPDRATEACARHIRAAAAVSVARLSQLREEKSS